MVRDLWRYRAFVVGMIGRELRLRYLDSALGGAWAILQPLALIALLTAVLGGVLSDRAGLDGRLTYGLLACVGVFAWNAFAETVTRCQTIFVEHGELLKKIRFPRLTLPLVALGIATANLAVGLVLLLALLALGGHWPGWALLGAVPLLAFHLATALGAGIVVGLLYVFARDVGPLVTLGLQVLFWLTPVVYPLSLLHGAARALVQLNPLTHVVTAVQAALLDGTWPGALQLAVPLAAAVAALALARALAARLGDHLADYL